MVPEGFIPSSVVTGRSGVLDCLEADLDEE